MNIQWQNSENVTINNTSTSTILEDASEVLSYYADKYIITKYPIKTGDLVEYAGVTYIVSSQIDRNIENRKENQYNYRARIRQADYTIKIVIDGKVEIFPSIIEGQTFDIVNGQFFKLSDDKIIATLKASDNTYKILKGSRFIKFNQAWKVTGIDYTKIGLITLFCDSDLIDPNMDDLENEIANKDLLVETEPEEPTKLTITGVDKISVYDDPQTFTVNSDLEVVWSISGGTAKISSQSGNSCVVTYVNDMQFGSNTLRVELVADGTVFAEKSIEIVFM